MLPKSVRTLRIDINIGQVRKSIAICQNDSILPLLNFQLVENGAAVDLSNVLISEILIHKENGGEADNPCVIDGDTVQYQLHSTDINALGINTAQIMLTFMDGRTLTTPSFELVVYSKVIDQRVQQATNEYEAIAEKLIIATNAADSAAVSASEADTSANLASEYEQSASIYASEASSEASEASSLASEAADYATSASEHNSEAANYATSTSEYLSSASEYASTAASEATIAANYATSTSEYLSSASEYASVAGSHASTAGSYASEGANYLSSTSEYASSAASEASVADSCATQAEYWYNQAEAIAEGFAGTLFPMGTVTFANLPALSSAQAGWMYNISDEFTTTSDFLEGEGKSVPAGSNVYKTSQGKWDILAGSPVTGVKGDSESVYRRGNVNITPSNIGLGNVRNEDIGSGDISDYGANVKAAILTIAGYFASYQPLLTNPLVQGDIVDNLTSTSTTAPLSAAQGKVLRDDVGSLSSLATTTNTSIVAAINELNTRLSVIEGEIGYPIAPPSNNNNE